MATREVQRVESSDGHRIRLDIHRPVNSGASPRVVILLHGIFTNRSDGNGEQIGDQLADAGITAIRFDFRGHGESSWSSTLFSPLSAARDLHAVILWCKANSASISLLGISFGGGIALTYLGLNPTFTMSRMVLLSPVIDYQATFISPELPWGKGLFNAERVEQLKNNAKTRLTPHFVAGASLYEEMVFLRPYKALETVNCNTLLVHGSQDDKVPVSAVRQHSSQFASTVTYLEVPDADHSLASSSIELELDRRIVSWFGGM